VWPILLFVVAMTIVTELAAEAGVFRVVAECAARGAGGRGWLLWVFVVAIALVSTIFLSLDTTAVLLTPVVVLVARSAGVPPLPFAMTTVWLANTGSLLLPVSNLTNLLAVRALGGISPAAFVALMWAPALAAVCVPIAALAVVYRRQLFASYQVQPRGELSDRVLLVTSGAVVAVLLPTLVSGLPVWVPTAAAAMALVVLFAVRRRTVLRPRIVPWRLILLASGLFLVVATVQRAGLNSVIAVVAGAGDGPLNLLRLAGSAALSANLIDNLPAYLAFESVAGDPARVAAVLIGVNVGCLITPWASLATLLWHSRLSGLGVVVSWPRFALLGLVVAPLSVALAVGALALFTVR
jgi:Na+/H+ antiporter NhaD/arsenite permease-like protein